MISDHHDNFYADYGHNEDRIQDHYEDYRNIEDSMEH